MYDLINKFPYFHITINTARAFAVMFHMISRNIQTLIYRTHLVRSYYEAYLNIILIEYQEGISTYQSRCRKKPVVDVLLL